MINSINLLKQLIMINTKPDNSNKEIIDFILKFIKDNSTQKFEYNIIEHKKESLVLYDLIVKLKSNSNNKRSPIIFAMHLDTVFGDWFTSVKETKSELIGLGSSDMKSGIACAITSSLMKDYSRDIYLCFSSDEETTAQGCNLIVKKLSSLISKNVVKPNVIITEPTSDKIVLGQNTIVEYTLYTKGKQMHSSLSTYDKTIKYNAITIMSTLISKLSDFHKKNQKHITQNLGTIYGGSALNVVAEECELNFSQRISPIADYKKIIENTKKLIKQNKGIVKVNFIGNGFHSSNSKLISKIKQISNKTLKIHDGFYKAWSEAGVYSKIGTPILFGPGKIESAHTVNESVSKDEVNKFVKIYSDMLSELD